jgi:hypothetical protein
MGVLNELAPTLEKGAQWALRAGEAALEREGPSGAMISKLVPKVLEDGELAAGPYVQKIRGMLKDVGPAARDSIREYLDKGTMPPTPDLHAKGIELSQILDDHWGEAIKLGIGNPRNKVKSYYPHMWENGLYDPGLKRDAILEDWVKKGRYPNKIAAGKALDYTAGKGGKMYNLEVPRLKNEEGYRTELEGVLVDHVSKAQRRFAEVKAFGPKDEHLQKMLEGLKAEGGNLDLADTVVSHRLGRSVASASNFKGFQHKNWENMLGSMQVARKLSLAVFSHPSQLAVNTPLVTGMGPFVRAVAHTIAQHGQAEDFAVLSAAIGPEVRRELHRETNLAYEGLGNKVLQHTGFYWADKIRRTIAASAGKFAAQEAFQKLLKNPADREAMQKLHWMGAGVQEALQKGKLSELDLSRAGKRVSDTTQFRSNAFTAPVWWRSTPEHRVITLFKQFFFHQAKFIKDFAGVPAMDYIRTGGREGSIKPLMLLGLLAPTFGELQADLRSAVRGKLSDRPEFGKHPVERIADDIANVGAFGIYYDVLRNLGGRTVTPLYHFVVGPAIGDVVDTAYSLSDPLRRMYKGQPHPLDRLTKDAEQQLTRSIPLVGPYAARKLWPPKQHQP